MKIYSFGLGVNHEEESSWVLGGKGAGLVRMSRLGVNVPPGFIIPCTAMEDYQHDPSCFLHNLNYELEVYLKKLEDKFGYKPLVSVRSGAPVSMPGALETILNVGIDEDSFQFWVKQLGPDCVVKSSDRLISMYASIVKGLDRSNFECEPGQSGQVYYSLTQEEFPTAHNQLINSIRAVLDSWNSERAKTYRKIHDIPDAMGTAVVVQVMVFGNLNEKSGTGVLFSRNPDNGSTGCIGEFLVNAQGEDVVDGSHTPISLEKMKDWNTQVYTELIEVSLKLEKEYKDVQDIEFTIQDGELFILQTRNAKRQPQAAINIALDLYEEGLITAEEVTKRVTARHYDLSQKTILDPKFTKTPFAKGIAASSGIAIGKIVYSSSDAINCTEPCILVTKETSPDDIAGMHAAQGVITMTGGQTCHSAVVMRGMNKPCIVGVGKSIFDFEKSTLFSMDGGSGNIWKGEAPVIDGTNNAAAKRYLAFLRTQYKYVPIVYGPNSGELEEALYHPQPSPLYAEVDKGNIKQLLNCVKILYVDLRASRIDQSELDFFGLFTDKGSTGNTSGIENFIGSLPPEERKRVVLIGPSKKWKGVRTIKTIKTLEDWIIAEDYGFIEGFFQKDTLEKLDNWRLAAEGKTVEICEYNHLSSGKKCFLTDVKVLQTGL